MILDREQWETLRATLLVVLAQAPDQPAGALLLAEVVRDQLDDLEDVTGDQVATALAWLGEQGLVTLRQPGGVTMATLTPRGAEVAARRAIVPGVRHPEPQE